MNESKRHSEKAQRSWKCSVFLNLFYQSQTGILCSSLAIPPGKEKTLLLSHELEKEIHKQRKLHIGNTEEMKIAKKQADFDIMSENVPKNKKRTGREGSCYAMWSTRLKIILEERVYGWFKALGLRWLHSIRELGSGLGNQP